MKHLIARDVIVGSMQSGYRFTVELQRMWVLKYRRLDWAQEEIKGWLAQQPKEQTPVLEPKTASPRLNWRPAILLTILVIIGLFLLAILFSPSRNFLLGAIQPIRSASVTVVTNEQIIQEAQQVIAMVHYDGNVLTGTSGGLVAWDMDGNHTLYTSDDTGLDSNCVNDLQPDPAGGIWLACGGVSHVEHDSSGIVNAEYYDRDSWPRDGRCADIAGGFWRAIFGQGVRRILAAPLSAVSWVGPG